MWNYVETEGHENESNNARFRGPLCVLEVAMEKEKNESRIRLLRLLQLLETDSDAEHPISTPECIRLLKERWSIDSFRITIGRDMEALAMAGYDVRTIAHAHGALFHTDAVQAVGHIKIDVHELGVDMLSASAHKFNGPKGIGFLYIRKGIELSSYADGGAQERNLRAGTQNVPAIVGMATALKNNCANIEQNQAKIHALEKKLLHELDDCCLQYSRNGGNYTLPGLISLSFRDKDGEAILHRLDLMGICISTGAACNSVNTQISHVLNAIGIEKNIAAGTIRVSLGKENTEADVDALVSALAKVHLLIP